MKIHESRVTSFNGPPRESGAYVLYWMQQSQRVRDNAALDFARVRAAELGLPLLVCFVITDSFPGANARHYAFMLEGLAETGRELMRAGAQFVLRRGDVAGEVVGLARDAAVLVCDRGYTRLQRRWRGQVVRHAGCRSFEVEADSVVPVELVSSKAEYMARTLRPKIRRWLDSFLVPLAPVPAVPRFVGRVPAGLDVSRPTKLLAGLNVDRSVAPVSDFLRGGTSAAEGLLASFVRTGLPGYADRGGKPVGGAVSMLSPYLHFGQISPLTVARAIKDAGRAAPADRDAFMEQLIVRRELAFNFVWHRPDDYDSLSCLPDWARKTMAAHAGDKREYLYTAAEFEACRTHDPFWNAAMRQMRATGYMHGYMRMYWGKKIIEWSASFEEAFISMLGLNNKYFLDGRDPNSFAGVAWCFGLHDQAWKERHVMGKLRYMNESGLRRKIDSRAYLEWAKNMFGPDGGARREKDF